ncbi:6119_t:CDS:1, partial [Gigaspora rosea]
MDYRFIQNYPQFYKTPDTAFRVVSVLVQVLTNPSRKHKLEKE